MNKNNIYEPTLRGGETTTENYQTDFPCYDELRNSIGPVIADNLPEDLNFQSNHSNTTTSTKKTNNKPKRTKKTRKKSTKTKKSYKKQKQ